MNEGQWNELKQASTLVGDLIVERPDCHQVPGPMARSLNRSEHYCRVASKADRMRHPMNVAPLFRRDLVRTDNRPDGIVENLSGRSGQGRETRRLQAL